MFFKQTLNDQSIYLKSISEDDTLESMVDIALQTLWNAKQLEVNKNGI